MKNGNIPIIKLIKVVIGWSNSHIIEQELINKSIKFGFNLTNSDDRGEGSINKIITKFQKDKISNTLKEGYLSGRIKPTRIKSVSIFDLNGNFIEKFKSCSECVKSLKIPQSSLENILSKRVKRWKNYQITYGENPGKYIGRLRYNQNNKIIFICNITSNEILEFESFKFAAKYLKISSPTIRRYINKLYKGTFYISNARIKLDEFRELSACNDGDNPEPSIKYTL
jgi:hypothetical protein